MALRRADMRKAGEVCHGVAKASISSFPAMQTLVCGIVLALCCFASMWWASAVICSLTFVAYVCLVLFRSPMLAVKYLVVLVGMALNITGCLSCEFMGDYLPELQVDAHFSGSVPLLVLAHWLLFVVLVALESRQSCDKPDKKDDCYVERNALVMWFSFAVGVLVLVLFIKVLPSPSFLNGLDRFSYASEYLSGPWKTLSDFLNYAMVFPLLAMSRGYKKSGTFICAIYLVYLFWIGTKFGQFLTFFSIALWVYYPRIAKLEFRRLRKFFVAVAGILCCLMMLGVFANSLVSVRSVSQYVPQRLAQQGQLWWSTYDNYPGGSGFESIGEEIEGQAHDDGTISGNVGSRFGVYNIMYLNAPESLIDSVLERGSRYTEAGYAAAYYYCGWPGMLLFSLLEGVALYLVCTLALRAIARLYLVDALLLVRLFGVFRTTKSMFVFSSLFEPISLASYAWLAIFPFIRPSLEPYYLRFGITAKAQLCSCAERLSAVLSKRKTRGRE